MSDETDRQDLEDRVEQLESTISKMLPGRRDALKLGGAALVGGAAMSGSASAGTQQAGTIGTAAEPVDVNAEDIDAVSVNTDNLSADNVVLSQDTISNVTEFRGSNVSVPASTFETIFDVSGTVDVIGGSIMGLRIRELRITFDDGTTAVLYNATIRGEDQAGDEFHVMSVPSIKDVSKLEFKNNDTSTREFGYGVLTIS